MCGHSAAPGADASLAVTPETTLSHSHSSESDASKGSQSLRAFVPSSTLCASAFDLVTSTALPLSIVHHSLRVYLFAKWLAEREKSEWADSDLLFVACICHDLGATQAHNGPQRFEVEGADAAAEFLRRQGKSEAEVHEVWTAVALHTSPGIAERITPLARLVRLGVLIDFRPATRSSLGAAAYAEAIEAKLPRMEIEKILGDAVVQQAVQNPAKAPAASWPNNLYKAYLENPGWTGINRGF
ncbi:uncharacterized protein Z519_04717 [Cladophialophora bantiana CBS 173.52]|uniref:HD/PDEase domain-containing protein n=1 Tax=Cladophialophora bantiana (strain ATCC 10958 / CBS 173.52 / CDC B-1940 / NIH 8579) TaxID=1442370 RepID=A0A0D2HV40_CLAB1|nr:uncharacterized protein Z519_04717 [Cladophialophora bantiana CBS 173.52]KIW94740.1 hypothetical protein Z519_04717 [Cladophialophora bantiana CBS 173.52]